MAADLSLGSLILLERDYGSLISVNQKNGEPNWEKRFNYLKTAKFISLMSGNKFLVSGGLDYSIHVWRSFESNRKAGFGVWESMKIMYETTGTALIMSAGTTICGFLVLKLSPIPVIQDFGIVSSISVAFSLILALFVLPGLLAAEVKTSNDN